MFNLLLLLYRMFIFQENVFFFVIIPVDLMKVSCILVFEKIQLE